MWRTLAGYLLLLGLFGGVVSVCPPENLTRPCKCTNNVLRCENITDTADLEGVFKRTNGTFFSQFVLVNSQIDSIPSSSLNDKKFEVIGVKNSKLTTLFDRTPPPSSSVWALLLINVDFPEPLRFDQLKPLQKLTTLATYDMKIPVLDSSFKDSVNKDLAHFVLRNTSTTRIDDGVLSDFEHLEEIGIENNPQLSSYKRNYFSTPSNIKKLYLNGNQLETLPPDAFAEMPKLEVLKMKDNRLSTLQDDVFSQIGHQLNVLELDGNPLDCNCAFDWLISNRPKKSFTGICANPENLKDKPVADLQIEDLADCH